MDELAIAIDALSAFRERYKAAHPTSFIERLLEVIIMQLKAARSQLEAVGELQHDQHSS